MGRNKFADSEIKQIAKLLRLKNAGNRAKQKLVRHDLRTLFEFNISDFNVPGKAFGEAELYVLSSAEPSKYSMMLLLRI